MKRLPSHIYTGETIIPFVFGENNKISEANMAKWIWYPGDFELYHSMLVHNRREKRGMYYSPMWRVDSPHRNMRFYKIAVLEKPEHIKVVSHIADTELVVNGTKMPTNSDITLGPGKNFIKISVFSQDTFPYVYCEGETFASDESWMTATFGEGDCHVGTNEMYCLPEDDPAVFLPFTKPSHLLRIHLWILSRRSYF